MTRIAGVDVRALLGSVAGPLLPSVSVVKRTRSARDPLAPTAGRPLTIETFNGKGVVGYEETTVDGLTRQRLVATLIAGTFPSDFQPDVDDHVEQSGKSYRILSVNRDPASASFVCGVEG